MKKLLIIVVVVMFGISPTISAAQTVQSELTPEARTVLINELTNQLIQLYQALLAQLQDQLSRQISDVADDVQTIRQSTDNLAGNSASDQAEVLPSGRLRLSASDNAFQVNFLTYSSDRDAGDLQITPPQGFRQQGQMTVECGRVTRGDYCNKYVHFVSNEQASDGEVSDLPDNGQEYSFIIEAWGVTYNESVKKNESITLFDR